MRSGSYSRVKYIYIEGSKSLFYLDFFTEERVSQTYILFTVRWDPNMGRQDPSLSWIYLIYN